MKNSIFLSGPIKQTGVVHCCKCDSDIQQPHRAQAEVGFHGERVTEHWCLRCGYILSRKDIDKFFPAEQWTDTRK